MKLTLHVVSRSAEPFDLHVEIDSYIIGRSSNADLVIRDPSISRKHARLFYDDKTLFLEDLDSHNGTWHNGNEVHNRVQVSIGDTVELARDPDKEACALSIRIKPMEERAAKYGVGTDTQESIVRSVRELFESQTLADIMGIEEAEELRDYAERLRILNEVHNAMSTSMNVQDLLELILDRVFTFLEPEAATIYLETDGVLELAAQRVISGKQEKPVFSETLVKQMSQGGNALLVHDALHDTRFAEAKSLHTEGIRSMVASPLVDDHGSLGLIMLYSRGVFGQFSEQDMELLVSLASVATLRLRNLQLVEKSRDRLRRMVEEQTRELNARKEELETLDTIVRIINMETSLERVLNSVLEQGSVLFPQAEKGIFLLREHGEAPFRVWASMGFGKEFTNLSLTHEEVIKRYARGSQQLDQGVYLSESHETNATALHIPDHPMPKSVLVMSIVLDGRPEGFVVFYNFVGEGFNQADLNRLGRFRDHAASAVAKARMTHTLETKTDAIARTQNQLLIREKMASLGHLTAGISHEINNPNNYIYGGVQNLEVFHKEFKQYLYMLAGDDLDDNLKKVFDDWFSKLGEQVKTIKVGSKRINSIVTDLQLVSRLDEAQRKHVDLLHSLSACVNLMEPNFHHVSFNCDFRGPLVIDCFPAELNQVFMNIIVNACEAMAPPAEDDPPTLQELAVQARQEGQWAKITFRDTGPGIEPNHLAKIYEAFFTTKPPGENSGLGLYTCYNVVERHGGNINIESEVGLGTMVSIRLPLDPESL